MRCAMMRPALREMLLQRWREVVLGTEIEPARDPYASHVAALGEKASVHLNVLSPGQRRIFSDLPLTTPAKDDHAGITHHAIRMWTSVDRLATIAEAWAQPGTGLTGDSEVVLRVVDALDHFHDRFYGPHTEKLGNWWRWMIGIPRSVVDIAAIVHEHLSPTQIATYCAAIDHYAPDRVFDNYAGLSTAANRLSFCRNTAGRGILEGNPQKVALAAGGIAPAIALVERGDGFYPDGSFIQHDWVPYIGGYGLNLYENVSRLFTVLRGTEWELPAEESADFLNTVETAVAPFVYNGLMMSAVVGREIARSAQTEQHKARAISSSILMLADATPKRAQAWRAMVKGWLKRDTALSLEHDLNITLAQLSRLDAVLRDRSVTASAESRGHRHFHHMDRSVHRGEGWAASLAMSSERIAYYEYGNGENPRGYHTGSGWVSWWGDGFGQDHVSDQFWPTADPYRLPGTTVSMLPLPDGWGGMFNQPRPDTRFTGGVTDGTVGSAVQELAGPGGTMQAHKSWFFNDHTIVCLGSSITSSDGDPVVTTIDNRNLGKTGIPHLTIDGEVLEPVGDGSVVSASEWIHHDGVAGYHLLDGTKARLELTERSGSWHDINPHTEGDVVHTRRYLTTTIDHGTDPDGASYAYLMRPGASREETERWSCTDGIELVSHTDAVHAIRLPDEQALLAHFWEHGSAGALTASGRCCILVREHGDGRVVIVVSDPARENPLLGVRWDRPVTRVVSAPPSLHRYVTGDHLSLTFDGLDTQAGAPQEVIVELATEGAAVESRIVV